MDSCRDFKDRPWYVNDRVRLYPFGEGKIADCLSAALVRVVFDNGLRETISPAALTLVRRRTSDEVPL